MKKRYKIKNKKFKIIISILLCAIAFLTIGYSSFSSELNIDGLFAIVRIQKDIRITGVSVNNTTSNATSDWEDYNVENIYSSINLPNSNSTISFDVEVTNLGNMEASISEISGLPSNITYSISNYNLRDMLCDDNDSTQCKLGSVSTITITIGYAKNGYNSNSTNYNIELDFTFSYMIDSVAKIGNTYYDTLQEAITAVPNNKTETEIVLLKNTSEAVTMDKNKNIILNLNGKTLSNNGNTNVIINKGILQIKNGTVSSNAATNGAINNESGAQITISSGRIVMTGGRQALYNNKGNATITGSAYLSSSATERAAVQNLAGSTLNILGGTIVSTGSNGVQNAGTMTIGTKDGAVSKTNPVLQGVTYGLTTSVNFNLYDGILKGITAGINSVSRIVELEEGYGIINNEETINGTVYKTLYQGISNKVTFNPNGGTLSETTKYIEHGKPVGTLPIPTKVGNDFAGWFTAASGGTEITSSTIINDEITFYAHWNKIGEVALIGTTIYDTLQEAINAAAANTQTRIKLLKNVSEYLQVISSKNIILDLDGKTISNFGNKSVFENNGNLTIINGTITSNADVGTINNNAGRLTISNGARIVATGTRQAVYINAGVVEITGTAYLSSQTFGTPTTSTMERGTIQCLADGTLIITGGTIIGDKQQAISNEGNLTIGTKDGNINSQTPILIGAINGIRTSGTFNFYDGIIKGKTDAIDGTITEQETNSQVVNGTETISGSTYNTAHLEPSE